MPNIDAAQLSTYVENIFVATGSPPVDAETVASHLVESNLKGHDSHGVIRVVQYVEAVQAGRLHPDVETEVVSETDTTAVLDGHWNYGQVVGRNAMEIAIAKARNHGVGMVVAHHAGHAGRIGTYGEQAARAGLITIACVNVHGGSQWVAPFGGAARRLSTNPLVIAGPTSDPDAPFVLDMATSMGAEGKVRVARNRGEQLKPGWILDADGNPTTEPWDLYGGDPPGSRRAGALLPVGGSVGHKGFGLSMAVELLAGALTPAGVVRPDATGGGNGIFMLTIDPNRTVGLGPFSEALSAAVDYVKTPPFAPGFDAILTAGDPERQRMAERLAAGIPLDEETWGEIAHAAELVGVAPYAGAIH
jgi:uncharacterized oxidoreductase